jgi:hypothetical protein
MSSVKFVTTSKTSKTSKIADDASTRTSPKGYGVSNVIPKKAVQIVVTIGTSGKNDKCTEAVNVPVTQVLPVVTFDGFVANPESLKGLENVMERRATELLESEQTELTREFARSENIAFSGLVKCITTAMNTAMRFEKTILQQPCATALFGYLHAIAELVSANSEVVSGLPDNIQESIRQSALTAHKYHVLACPTDDAIKQGCKDYQIVKTTIPTGPGKFDQVFIGTASGVQMTAFEGRVAKFVSVLTAQIDQLVGWIRDINYVISELYNAKTNLHEGLKALKGSVYAPGTGENIKYELSRNKKAIEAYKKRKEILSRSIKTLNDLIVSTNVGFYITILNRSIWCSGNDTNVTTPQGVESTTGTEAFKKVVSLIGKRIVGRVNLVNKKPKKNTSVEVVDVKDLGDECNNQEDQSEYDEESYSEDDYQNSESDGDEDLEGDEKV